MGFLMLLIVQNTVCETWVSTFKAKKNEERKKRLEIGKIKPQV
jgi:hypothetical protein